jgi:protein SCO1/2
MDRKVIWVGFVSLTVVLVGILAAFIFARPPAFVGTVYDSKVAPEIVLPMANGSEFRLSAQQGRVVLLFFGFTNCPDVCPTTLANLKQVTSQLGADAARVQVVFIAVDPARDTSDLMQAYADRFDPSFLGLSGSMVELGKVWNEYGVYRELGAKDANGNYEVTHSARVTVIDPRGNLRLSFNVGVRWQDILHDVKILLAEK